MGIFNEQAASTSSTTSSGERGLPGPVGPEGRPGIGFKLDGNGNYDMENKKLTNVRNGDEEKDVMVKTQIEG